MPFDAGFEIFGVDIDEDFHGSSADKDDLSDEGDQFADFDWFVEVDLVETGGDASGSGMLGRCCVSAKVNLCEEFTSEELSEKVGFVGADDLGDGHLGVGGSHSLHEFEFTWVWGFVVWAPTQRVRGTLASLHVRQLGTRFHFEYPIYSTFHQVSNRPRKVIYCINPELVIYLDKIEILIESKS